MAVLVRYLAYPVIVIGGAAVAIGLLSAGSGFWRIGPPILAIAALLVAALERMLPYDSSWNRDHDDTRTDIAHLIGNLAVSHASLAAFAVTRPTWHGAALWPAHWPFWLQALLGLAIVDLGLYAVHRASHGLGCLWRLHAIHHSSRRVYWVNGQRRHLLHELIEGAPGLTVVLLAGAPVSVYAAAITIVTLHLFMQHANIDYLLGPLRFVFSGAELHRWHHQRRWRDVQGNYAAVFALWDHLFGSSLAQRGPAPADVGMDDEPDLPADYRGQLVWPFTQTS